MAAYCTLAELADLGINPAAFVNTVATRRTDAIDKVSDFIDTFLGRYTLPLGSPLPGALVRCCAILTSIDLIRNRGVSPEDGARLDDEYDRQIDWLTMIAKGILTLIPELPFDPTLPIAGAPRVASELSRGYSRRPGGPELSRWPQAGWWTRGSWWGPY